MDVVGFSPSGSGEDDVGHLGGLGEKDIDDDEVIERLECFLTVVFIGVGDDGVFAVDEHGVDAIAAPVKSGHLGHGIAEVEVGLLVGFFKLFLTLGFGDRLEAGVV